MIWCDLDHTLIWIWDPLVTTPFMSAVLNLSLENKPPTGRGRRRLTRIAVPQLGVGFACARRSAKPFLRQLRSLDRVILLTNALRPYAAAMNSTFGLGFSGEDMITREDFGHRTGVDPTGVLVDNEAEFDTDTSQYRARSRKMLYLGIPTNAVVEVPYFRGDVADEFEDQWHKYAERVAAILQR